jgi:hypothetical protein
MGFDVANLVKLADPGALAHAMADAILPPDMQWMGGLLGAAVDLQAGNPLGAATQALDSVKDLNELSAQQKQKPGPSEPAGGWQHEPSPPPLSSRSTEVKTSTTFSSSRNVSETTTVTTSTTVSTSDSTSAAQTGKNVIADGKAVADAYFKPTPPASSPPPSAWRETSPSAGQPASGTLRATPPISSLPFGHDLGQAVIDSFRRMTGPKDPASMSKAEFMAQDNEAFMKAVRDGKIPKEISDSPAAMQALQARMNSISEMNQLMTSMIQAMHQMQMAVIQNVRV